MKFSNANVPTLPAEIQTFQSESHGIIYARTFNFIIIKSHQ